MTDNGVLIVYYHRVSLLPELPGDLAISPEKFAEHLDFLSRYCRPISLSDAIAALKEKKTLHRAVVVTFDDGYADNFYNAKPLLERFGVPATVFVVSGFVGSDREFYWDELERWILTGLPSRKEISITVDGQVMTYSLETFEDRKQTYLRLLDSIRPLPPEERESVLRQVRAQLGEDEKGRSGYRVMNPEELVTLSNSGLVEIGAHTVHHVDLARLPEEIQWQEILGSKRQLESLLGRPVRFFAYPYGSGTELTRQLVQKAGFEAACGTKWKIATTASDIFWLPRVRVKCWWDGERFAKRLEEIWLMWQSGEML